MVVVGGVDLVDVAFSGADGCMWAYFWCGSVDLLVVFGERVDFFGCFYFVGGIEWVGFFCGN